MGPGKEAQDHASWCLHHFKNQPVNLKPRALTSHCFVCLIYILNVLLLSAVRCGCSITPCTKCLLQLVAIHEIHTPSLSAFLCAVGTALCFAHDSEGDVVLSGELSCFLNPLTAHWILFSAPRAALHQSNLFFFRKQQQQSKSGLLGFFLQSAG